MALPICPGCRKTIIPKSDDSCPNCGFKGVEKAQIGMETSPSTNQVVNEPLTQAAPASSTSPEPIGVEPRYGGFWIRLAALLLDLLILSPITLLNTWLLNFDRKIIYVALIPNLMVTIFYHILCVKILGGTPGKLLCGLRIVTTSFMPLGSKEAWLRYSMNLVLILLSTVWYVHAVEQMSDAEFLSLTFMEKSRRMRELGGSTWTLFYWLNQIWTWSEFIVLLTNRQRRALHDFIAGTVVIRTQRAG
ncbi:MAG: RDD family protein [Planctomycetes bacterium]|nr:RDD family protein [Planctomycetota bacterium]